MAATASIDAIEWLRKQVEAAPDGLRLMLTEMVNVLMNAEIDGHELHRVANGGYAFVPTLHRIRFAPPCPNAIELVSTAGEHCATLTFEAPFGCPLETIVGREGSVLQHTAGEPCTFAIWDRVFGEMR